MHPVLGLVALAPGLALGSFLNVVAARLPERRSVVHGRSHCPRCGQAISWYDNVPVLSYLVLRGRCRHCRGTISIRYLLVELAAAVLIALCFARFGLTGEAFLAAFFCAALVALAAIDAEHRILPDRIVLPSAGIVLVGQLALSPELWQEWILAPLALAGFLFCVLLAYPRGMGMGDVKLALLLGAGLGREVAVAMAIALLTGLAVSVVLLVREGSAARSIRVPFGVFLALGGIVALFAGEPLLERYLGLF